MKQPPKFSNRRARYDYELFDSLECGIMLVGTEVKSLRLGKCVLDGAWAKVENRELWLVGCEIPEYKYGNNMNHEPKRDRKLLIHRRELLKLIKKDGFTLIPVSLYFNDRGKVKVEIAVAKGKKKYDKRESIKAADAKKRINNAR